MVTVSSSRLPIVVAILVAGGVGLSAAGSSKPQANLVLQKLAPEPGTPVERYTIIEAVLEYAIESKRTGVDVYYIHIMFDSGDGGTFNMMDSLRDGVALTKPTGTVEIKYSLFREWDDPKLKRPITIRFFLLKRTGKHRSEVIAETDPASYPGEP